MRELTVTDWIFIWLLALTAVFIAHVNSHAETVLTSTESLKAGPDEVWIQWADCRKAWTINRRPSEFYYLEQTTESVKVERDYWDCATAWEKFRKVYYPIVKTECWEYWDNPMFAEPGTNQYYHKSIPVQGGKCFREIVFMKDGRILWREVKR